MIVTGKAVVDWVARSTNEFGSFGTDVGIGWERAGALVAGVAYAEWNGPNIVCHIASDGTRRWLTREYLWTIFDYPFNQVKAKRITVCVGAGNSDSRRFVQHLGFRLEATLRDAHPSGDLLIYAMFKERCKWITAAFYKPLAKAA
jgi:RimJ/RimL family protein N-acetyltransferase